MRVTLLICGDLSKYHSDDTIILSDSGSEHLQDSAHSHESELAHLSKPQDPALSQDPAHSYKHQDPALSQDPAYSYEHQDLAQYYNSHDMALSQDPGHSYELQNPVHWGGGRAHRIFVNPVILPNLMALNCIMLLPHFKLPKTYSQIPPLQVSIFREASL